MLLERPGVIRGITPGQFMSFHPVALHTDVAIMSGVDLIPVNKKTKNRR
jgi:hypothetical protein